MIVWLLLFLYEYLPLCFQYNKQCHKFNYHLDVVFCLTTHGVRQRNLIILEATLFLFTLNWVSRISCAFVQMYMCSNLPINMRQNRKNSYSTQDFDLKNKYRPITPNDIWIQNFNYFFFQLQIIWYVSISMIDLF